MSLSLPRKWAICVNQKGRELEWKNKKTKSYKSRPIIGRPISKCNYSTILYSQLKKNKKLIQSYPVIETRSDT